MFTCIRNEYYTCVGYLLSDEKADVEEVVENAMQDAKETIVNVRKMLTMKEEEGDLFYD